MINFNDKKNRKMLSTIIVVLLVLAMVVPLALSFRTF